MKLDSLRSGEARAALVVSQFMESRLPLHQILERCAIFDRVESAHDLEEAKALISAQQRFDHIFIANSFDALEVSKLVEWAKRRNSSPGVNSPGTIFVLVLRSGETLSATVARNMVVGFHGFLCEPYTVAAIEDVVSLSTGVHSKKSTARLRAATGLMLTEVLPHEQNADKANGDLWDRVQETCKEYKHLTGHSITTTVVKDLANLSPSERVPRYVGASERVHALFERRVKQTVATFQRPAKKGEK